MTGKPSGRRTHRCPPEHKHGLTSTCYGHGCGCDDCRAAAAQRQAARTKLIAYGRYESPNVDATLYREHLRRAVDLGIPVKRIAVMTGKNVRWLHDFLRDESRSISRANADIIAGIPLNPDLAAPTGQVKARGAVRRLRALQRQGWTLARLTAEASRRVGYHYFADLCRAGEGALITEATHAEVSALYDRLWDVRPWFANGLAADASRRTVERARRLGWAGPLDWDDIDADGGPARVEFVPRKEFVDVVVVELACGGRRPRRLSRAELRLVITELHSRQFGDPLIAERAGISDREVVRIRKHELGLPAVAYGVSVHRRVA